MIKLINLTKKYGNFLAVDNLSLEVPPGEIMGFLGPNGAGKTTTIKMMAGLLKPSSGTVEIGGFDIGKQHQEAKRLFGFIPDRPYIYDKLTGGEFLSFISQLYQLNGAKKNLRIAKLLELFALTDWEHELVESYSHGMKQRLVMAAALVHSPKVLIVDEPMVGLDPKAAKLVKRIFKTLAQEGVALFMSTHTLEVAEETCHRIAIIQGGKILAVGTKESLWELARSEDKKLESIFLRLTGGLAEDALEGLQEES